MIELLKLLQRGKVFGRIELNGTQCEILLDKLKEIELNEKILGIAKTQILEYSQGYKDGLNRETTATEIVARELELNYIREEIKRNYISKHKIREKLKIREEEKAECTDSNEARLILREIYLLRELLKSEVEQ